MGLSVYQRVLGDEFAKLTPELQRYFGMPDAGTHGEGTGVFEVAGSRHRWLWPLFAAFAGQQILFAEYGRDVPFDIVNQPAGDVLRATRVFHFPGRPRTPGSSGKLGHDSASGHDSIIVDEMRFIDGELHDFLGKRKNLEVALRLSVADGALAMVSTGARVWFGQRRVRLPALFSARVELTEAWGNGRQRVSVLLRHPLLGELFVYRGAFEYRWVNDERPAEAGLSNE
jgi:hypothetical protein